MIGRGLGLARKIASINKMMTGAVQPILRRYGFAIISILLSARSGR